ncbi:hypothetical protein TTHERM_01119480 (macronuclear) [Tetrahymena thermophila SB210]|uniref:Uncharacterized protein n=1 Tax=Tetrahymena thermophila (strain SB210) TaxID=312017 RepID=Q239N2_TETTS|nr:hypothetical protein TTHERM_01119480 [Tetrahymena thermophila SB210]EAR93238.1 hypothetical protein TTHERM_01119480 [Tetrahymena thermophila SB210]|eukprot:XP_001013483.1 hypothetical protein TTHERM_01119480 [Tetrahymena thermophila SB210]
MYSEYLKDKLDDPFWKDILNGSYESIQSNLDMLKSEIQKNRFEMKQQISANLNDYVKSQESAIKLTQELNRIRVSSKAEQFKKQIKLFKIVNANSEGADANTATQKSQVQDQQEGGKAILLQSQSLFEKFKRCQQENDYMEIFEVESVIQRCLKAEDYEELSKLLFWLEKLILKNKDNASLHKIFSEIMKKYRKVLCNILFQNYNKSKKDKLKKFFIDFGKNLKSQKDSYLFEIFQAHFAKKFKQIFEKNKTQLVQINHIANIFDIYGKSLNKSVLFVQEINESLKEKEQIKILQFVNKFRKNLIDLIDKVRNNKLNEIKIRIAQFQEPLKTHLRLGSVDQLQISLQTKVFLIKAKAFLRYRNRFLITLGELKVIENEQEMFNEMVKNSEGIQVLLNMIKVYRFLLQTNRINEQKIDEYVSQFIEHVSKEIQNLIQIYYNTEDLKQTAEELDNKRKILIEMLFKQRKNF